MSPTLYQLSLLDPLHFITEHTNPQKCQQVEVALLLAFACLTNCSKVIVNIYDHTSLLQPLGDKTTFIPLCYNCLMTKPQTSIPLCYNCLMTKPNIHTTVTTVWWQNHIHAPLLKPFDEKNTNIHNILLQPFDEKIINNHSTLLQPFDDKTINIHTTLLNRLMTKP